MSCSIFATFRVPAMGVLLLGLGIGDAIAQESMPLWAEGAPGALGKEAKDIPQGIVSLPESAIGPTAALVICPGGGYGHLAMDHEGKQIAKWANDLGMAAIICDYRHRGKGYGHPAPLQDAQRAVRLARANATKWNIDPARVGILGFSAGGHLVSTVLTHFDEGDSSSPDKVAQQSSRPDFGVLCYPVICLGQPCTHMGSQKNLLGDNASQELIASLSNEKQIKANTPPVFLFHTQEDKAVPAENSIKFYASMVEKNVPGELHIFQKGNHGIGLGKGVPGAEAWSENCAKWLKNIGVLK